MFGKYWERSRVNANELYTRCLIIARAWPSGSARAKVSCIQVNGLYTPLVLEVIKL